MIYSWLCLKAITWRVMSTTSIIFSHLRVMRPILRCLRLRNRWAVPLNETWGKSGSSHHILVTCIDDRKAAGKMIGMAQINQCTFPGSRDYHIRSSALMRNWTTISRQRRLQCPSNRNWDGYDHHPDDLGKKTRQDYRERARPIDRLRVCEIRSEN